MIFTSQTNESETEAESGIETVRKNGCSDANFERKTATSAQPYSVLKAANGQITGTCEMDESEGGRDKGIKSVQLNRPSIGVKDLT